uniref:Uncharacterized protein n=1 Tax=Oryza sativa subsp. japonica TaxID=39947 RepID=Q10L23_ORYSJ|nr:hypothetical protein LOC_Os03g24699 [Oryza sativa Japonica Group]
MRKKTKRDREDMWDSQI